MDCDDDCIKLMDEIFELLRTLRKTVDEEEKKKISEKIKIKRAKFNNPGNQNKSIFNFNRIYVIIIIYFISEKLRSKSNFI